MLGMAAAEDDEFIVPAVVAERGRTGAQQEDAAGAFGWGLKKLGGLVFSNPSDPSTSEPSCSAGAVQESSLPPGFSAIINAEEEKIYPAEAKIKVLVAEGSLSGQARRQAAELHQALQQVVGSAAIYNHLLTKHGGVGTRSKACVSHPVTAAGKAAACDCDGMTGSCKAISSLLRDELNKVNKAAESERRGALLKKFRQVERRSGGLCNADLLEKVVRSSSANSNSNPNSDPSNPSPSSHPKRPPHLLKSPLHATLPGSCGRRASAPTNGGNAGNMSLIGLNSPTFGRGGTPEGFPKLKAGGGVGVEGGSVEDFPWADDMLCQSSRRRHGAMIKTRGRALAKGLAKMLKGVSSNLQGVASRLPPWDDADDEKPEKVMVRIITEDELLSGHNSSQSRSSFCSVDTAESLDNSSGHSTRSLEQQAAKHPTSTTSVAGNASGNVNKAIFGSGNTRMSGSGNTQVFGNGNTKIAGSGNTKIAGSGNTKMSGSGNTKVAGNGNTKMSGNGSRGVLRPTDNNVISRNSSNSNSSSSNSSNAKEEVRQWKLNAQELSLIRREEERVVAPHVLAKLLAAGAVLQCVDQQTVFWDVFARLEVTTRTEALLNIAIRGGRGCSARCGRMGRELCISLTSVVLEAIHSVEQEKARLQSQPPSLSLSSSSSYSGQRSPQQHADANTANTNTNTTTNSNTNNTSGSSSSSGDTDSAQRQQTTATRTAAAEKRRPSSARLSRTSAKLMTPAEELHLLRQTFPSQFRHQQQQQQQQQQEGAMRARSESAGFIGSSSSGGLPPQRARWSLGGGRAAGVNAAATAATAAAAAAKQREDPGLRDLDAREEEFRKAIYVNRSSLTTRLLGLTHNAPLCAKILGTFVNDRGDASFRRGEETPRPSTTGSIAPAALFTSSTAQAWSNLGAPEKDENVISGDANNSYKNKNNTSTNNKNNNTATNNKNTANTTNNNSSSNSGGDVGKYVHVDVHSEGDTSCVSSCESHPSPSASTTSAATDPLSEGATDDSDPSLPWGHQSSSSWEDQQQQHHQQQRRHRQQQHQQKQSEEGQQAA